MQVIISPAKKIVVDTDSFPVKSQPVYAAAAQTLLRQLKQLSLAQVQKLWHCSAKLARENYRLLHSDFPQTPALFAFSGIQYQYAHPTSTGLFTSTLADFVRTLRDFASF